MRGEEFVQFAVYIQLVQLVEAGPFLCQQHARSAAISAAVVAVEGDGLVFSTHESLTLLFAFGFFAGYDGQAGLTPGVHAAF
jgi:hypothetical protein